MIASDQMALRVGSAKLIVDGTATTLARKAEISLGPSRVQAIPHSRLPRFARSQSSMAAYAPVRKSSRYWAFQWYETAIFFGLALVLAGFCLWWARRRLT